MKDVVLPLRIGYVNLLAGLVVEGKAIPVYDLVAPYPAQTPYIIIEQMNFQSDNTKDSFMWEGTVDLLIYTTYQGDFGGREYADKILNAIQQLIIPSPGKSGVSAEGFNVYMAKQSRSNDEFDYSTVKRTYRKRLTIDHLIQQAGRIY